MNKTELVNAIAEKANLSKVQAKAALEASLEAIAEGLAKGEKVALIGFGTFAVAERLNALVSTLQLRKKSLSLLRRLSNSKLVLN